MLQFLRIQWAETERRQRKESNSYLYHAWGPEHRFEVNSNSRSIEQASDKTCSSARSDLGCKSVSEQSIKCMKEKMENVISTSIQSKEVIANEKVHIMGYWAKEPCKICWERLNWLRETNLQKLDKRQVLYFVYQEEIIMIEETLKATRVDPGGNQWKKSDS